MTAALQIIQNDILTYSQKVLALAQNAESQLDVLQLSPEIQKLREQGVICDLFEGNAPYRPRYIIPDYARFMAQGSEFLKLSPAKNIWEATNNLLILYKHVPSITSFPVYIGNLDSLLEPYIDDEEQAYSAIKLFLMHIDRTITDSFCHANIGPRDSKAARLILRAERELQNAVPNLTLKYSSATPDDLAIAAIVTALITAKPSFANHQIFSQDLGEDYAIASCYNGLPIGGGAYTLVRLNLGHLVENVQDSEDFFNRGLPQAVANMLEYMDKRVNFLVEESGFFASSFLVKEGLIEQNRFTAMFGLVGLAECVNTLLNAQDKKQRFGHNEQANQFGLSIIEQINQLVAQHNNQHCRFSQGKYLLHAQVGIDLDKGISPGCRIPIGEEPEILAHISQSAPFHKYFPSGIGDIFNFDSTVKNNPQYVLDIIKGAFAKELRFFSLYSSDCDVIRITGYLVKRSEIEKLQKSQQVLHNSVVLGQGNVEHAKTLERKVRHG